MADLAELIGVLEKAKEPDRELDYEIARVSGWKSHPYVKDGGWYLWERPDGLREIGPPPYSFSVDAALTLLPDWASYELTRSAAGEPTFTRCRLWDWRRSPLALDPHNEWKSEDGNRPLPINICIAALKSRSPA